MTTAAPVIRPTAAAWRTPGRFALLLLALAAVLAFYPLYGAALFPGQHDYFLQKLTAIMILAMLAMSLDLLVGIGGMVSLGHAAFFGLGGYALALLGPEYEAANLWTTLPMTLGAVGLAALVIGALSIRTGGIYFIMITLAFGQMFYYVFNDAAFAGGSDGTYIYVRPAVEVFGVALLDLGNAVTFFYVVFAAMMGTYVFLRVLLASPFGKVLRGIGINPQRVRGVGYNPDAYKLVAFVIGAMLAGLAGYLSAAQFGFVNPSMMSWHHSGTVLVMVILGGLGTLHGAILGAFALEILHAVIEARTEHWLLVLGGLIIVMVLTLPKGIAGLLERLTAPRANRARTGHEDRGES